MPKNNDHVIEIVGLKELLDEADLSGWIELLSEFLARDYIEEMKTRVYSGDNIDYTTRTKDKL